MNALVNKWLQVLHQASQGVLSERCFQRGVDETALEAIEQHLGVVLPEDYKQLYRVFNGGNPDNEVFYGVLAGYEWLSAEQSLQIWLDWDKHGFNDGMDEMTEDYANDEGIQPVMWAKKWLPFGEDNGYYLLLDLDPADNGHYGQILALSGDGEPTVLLAPSIRVWLERYMADIESGVWVFDNQEYQSMILAAELAEHQAITHEKATQTGRFDLDVLAKQQAQWQAAQEKIMREMGEDMLGFLTGAMKK